MASKHSLHWTNNLHAAYRLLLGISLSVITYFLLSPFYLDWLTRIMICWDVFCICYIIMCWITILIMRPDEIRKSARDQDSTHVLIFTIILGAALLSLAAVLILLMQKNSDAIGKGLQTLIYVFGVSCSWVLVHSIFTFRYAHLYYGDDEDNPEVHAGGLSIPEEEHPDYLDIAYFSFVIGMTFQVSDITITSRRIRRLVLAHSIVSFIFNTLIVALSINAILDLKQ